MPKDKYLEIQHDLGMPLYDIHQALQDLEPDERAMTQSVPPEYHKYLSLFWKVNADQLPPA